MNNCPHCNVSLIGGPIPQELLDDGCYGDSTHWRREIGIEVRGVYDGTLMYKCPDCKKYWARFPWVKINEETGEIISIK